jgi:hypothetical protein
MGALEAIPEPKAEKPAPAARAKRAPRTAQANNKLAKVS